MAVGAYARQCGGRPKQTSDWWSGLVDNIADTVMGASDVIRRRVLHVVYASTSGHTEYVVDVLVDYLTSSAPGWEIQRAMAERTGPQDLLRGDVLLLASSTWDAGVSRGS
jgi:flavodoxin I